MQHNRFVLTAGLIFVLSVFSCSGKNELMLKKSEASKSLAEVYMAQGDYTLALSELLKALENNPNDPYIHNDLGLTFMAKERLDLAVKHFQKAIELDNNFAPARNNLGTAYMAMKNWDAAIAAFEEVTRDLLYATPHFAYANMGWAYYNKQSYDLAEKNYLEAIRLNPEFAIAIRGLGNVYLAIGRGAQAVEQIEKAIEIAPRIPELYFDLGKAYTMIKNKAKAKESFSKFISLAPELHPLLDEAKAAIQKK